MVMTKGSELENCTLAENHKDEYEQFGKQVSKTFILSAIVVFLIKSLNNCSLVQTLHCVYKSERTEKRKVKEQVRDGRLE
jgi:hypothetical protein